MRLVFLFILLLIVVNIFCQQSPKAEIKKSGEKSFRIVTTDSITNERIKRDLNGNITRIASVAKKDRQGRYWEYSFYFKNEDYTPILSYVKGLK